MDLDKNDDPLKEELLKVKGFVGQVKKKQIPVGDLEELLNYIKNNRKRFNDEIPFSAIAKDLNFDFEEITTGILQLILTKEIIGFINDKETEDKSDDILILRDQHLVDKMNQYRIE